MLADLSSIALEWSKNYVRQRQTFKMNTKGENTAPLAFQSNPDGTYQGLAVQLRNFGADVQDGDESSLAIVESADKTKGSPECTKTAKPHARSLETPSAPPETPAEWRR
jgi:hypothetical protein